MVQWIGSTEWILVLDPVVGISMVSQAVIWLVGLLFYQNLGYESPIGREQMV